MGEISRANGEHEVTLDVKDDNNPLPQNLPLSSTVSNAVDDSSSCVTVPFLQKVTNYTYGLCFSLLPFDLIEDGVQ